MHAQLTIPVYVFAAVFLFFGGICVLEALRRLQFRSVDDFLGALHRLDVIPGFERDACPAAVYLFRQPENVAATINAANFPLRHGAIFPRPLQSIRSKIGAHLFDRISNATARSDERSTFVSFSCPLLGTCFGTVTLYCHTFDICMGVHGPV